MNPDNYQNFLQAKKNLKQGNKNQALTILKNINTQEPYDNNVRFEIARILINAQETKKEGRIILLDLLNTKNRKCAMLELGKLYAREGNKKQAKYYFEKLIKEKAQNEEYAMLELGRLYAIENKTTKARQCFEELLDTKNRTYAMLELGKMYARKADNKQAHYYFEELIKEKAQNEEYAMLELGRLCVSEENPEQARQCFERLLSTKNRTYAMLELGRLYAREADNEQAHYYFEELIKEKAQNEEYAILELGRLYASEGNTEQARQCFGSLINKYTKKQEYAMLELLFTYIKEDNILEAKRIFEKVSKITKKFYNYRELEMYIKYRLGEPYDQNYTSYFINQLLNYDKKITIEHLKTHLYKKNNKTYHSLFDTNVNLELLFEEVENKIKYTNPMRFSLVEEYIIDCENTIAYIDSEEIKHVVVVTLPHTKNILTIYPIRIMNKNKNKTKQLVK